MTNENTNSGNDTIYTWKDAWVLLALRYVLSDRDIATVEDIIKAGVYINQSKLTQAEITDSTLRFEKDNLVQHTEAGYQFTEAFTPFWENCLASKICGVSSQLSALTDSLQALHSND